MAEVDENIRYLIILSCSQRKRTTADKLLATDRYDGGMFRILRNYLKQKPANVLLEVFIISAEYGLLSSTTLLPFYERKMNKKRAVFLQAEVSEAIKKLSELKFQRAYVDLSKVYSLTCPEIETYFQSREVHWGHGKIGQRLSQFKTWLINLSQET